MKPSKPFFLFLVILMGFFPLSCDLFCPDTCSCGGLTPSRDFVIDSMRVDIVVNNQHADPSQEYSIEELVLRVWPDEVTYASANNHAKAFSFVSSVFACDPIPPGSAHPLKAIKVSTNAGFEWKGRVIESTEDITDLFRVAGFASDPSFAYLLQNRFNFLGQEPLKIRLIDQPDTATAMDINLELTLSDGRKFLFERLKFRVR
jgi:hypothetical protein